VTLDLLQVPEDTIHDRVAASGCEKINRDVSYYTDASALISIVMQYPRRQHSSLRKVSWLPDV